MTAAAKRHNAERDFDRMAARRRIAESRYLDRIDDALQMVGQICRDGREVFYVWPQGGRYREGDPAELTAFLIRNRYA